MFEEKLQQPPGCGVEKHPMNLEIGGKVSGLYKVKSRMYRLMVLLGFAIRGTQAKTFNASNMLKSLMLH